MKAEATAQGIESALIGLREFRGLPRNPKAHDLGQLSSSMNRFGFLERVIINRVTGRLIAGHGRVDHLQQSKARGEDPPTNVQRSSGDWLVPTDYVSVPEEEEEAAAIALNRLTEIGGWEDTQLAAVLSDLAAADALEGIGYDAEDVDALLAELNGNGSGEGLTDPDAVPESPEEPITKRGDVWLLGRHRGMCGDSTSAADVEQLLDGDRPFLCVTDPPYGVSYDPAWRNRAAAEGKLSYAARRIGPVSNDERADWSAAWALFPGDVIYSWHPAGATSLVHAAALQASGFGLRMQIIWAKSNFPIGRGDYHVRHEPCWYAVREGKAAHRTNDRTQTTLWEINLDKNVEGGHSTQKPVECMARAIRNHETTEVYDPFCGSGTTIIAAERERGCCWAMELEPVYVDVICRRYQEYTGTLPVLESTGEEHDFVT
jgi:DNA modification methylase